MAADLQVSLTKNAYLRERLEPRPGDPLYLHLSDLGKALADAAKSCAGRTLDYGCGGSPYRGYFPKDYVRADLAGTPEIDITFGGDSVLPVESASFDLVVSTQVLEHVPQPVAYLTEAHRVLRPGGRMLLTTHGTFEEHGTPYDYRRWTASGLSGEIAACGFRIEQVCKLTTGPRALVFLWRRFQHTLDTKGGGPVAWPLAAAKRLLRLTPAALDQYCDRAYGRCRVVPAAEPGHEIYIALLVLASRP